ncbi:hypothetical protein CVT26_014169 [Gymnopilus dilepis]|uniref:Riboflavin synthase n=1 Tax=Gymnopilus dilepis TaxID=231916 RepID=A0A409VU18_9AGAR|nr:hypothetical protein CVT26_014169 [Gymnopilus dilepis]
MFTGLIEHMGTVSSIITDEGGCTLTIANSGPILGDCHIGDSIAVNGACLTVVEFDPLAEGGWFKVWLANETLDRTDLGERKVGDQVNLERAMGAHVRFGGHFVQAHVDGTATITDRIPDGESLRLTFQFPPPTPERPSLLPYLIPKGYVTIDGASLTLTGVNDAERTFSVMLIKHTQEMITLSRKPVGGKVNIEVDMVGNHVLSFLTSTSPDYGLGAYAQAKDSTFRPKAKVNSSATTRKAAGSTISSTASTTPRAGSPAKLTPRLKNGVVSPTAGSSSSTLKSPPPTSSAPGTPEVRKTYSLRADDSRSRSGSTTSLHHAASFSSFRPSSPSVVSVSAASGTGTASATASPRLMSSRSAAGLVDRTQTSSPTLKIRSKVSNLAKAASADSSSPPPSGSTSPPPGPSTRQPNARTRAPSSSSTLSQQPHSQSQHYTSSPKLSPASPPPVFYPITTAAPAANPHRFAPNRPPAATLATTRTGSPPAAAHHIFQSFSQPSSSSTLPDHSPTLSARPRSAGGLMLLNGSNTARVDPASIPLPPQSPPASAVSFSSRSSVSVSASSVSRSSAASVSQSVASSPTDGGYSPRQKRQSETADNLRNTLDNLVQYASARNDEEGFGHARDISADFELTDEEREVKAAAKSNRKIADLEITNRSLLAINATLEATKHRQAKEIAELRRKLRESRLILPPRAYRAVKSSLDPSELNDDEDLSEDDSDGDADGDGNEDAVAEGDETYKRIKVILENLLKSGQAALERQVKDFPEGSGRGGAKVLSPEEVKDWHGTKGHDEHEDLEDGASDTENYHSFSIESEAGRDHNDDEAEDDGYDDEGHSEIMDHNIPHDTDSNDAGLERDAEDGYEVGNETTVSEDEVEAMTIPAFSSSSPPSSPPPPGILITQPT